MKRASEGAKIESQVSIQLVDVWMEDLVHEANAGRLERILVGKLYVDLPHATSKGCYGG